MKYLEIKSYIQNGVRVVVKIDYQAKQISLVEVNDQSFPVSYPEKKWVFSKREIEYMDGWIDILDAMKHAVKEAKKELQAYIDEEENQKIELIRKIGEQENPSVDHSGSLHNGRRKK